MLGRLRFGSDSGSHPRPFDRESRIQNTFRDELENMFFHFFLDGKRVETVGKTRNNSETGPETHLKHQINS